MNGICVLYSPITITIGFATEEARPNKVKHVLFPDNVEINYFIFILYYFRLKDSLRHC